MIESRSFAEFFVRDAIVTPAGAYDAPPRMAIAVSESPELWRRIGTVGICGPMSRGRLVSGATRGATGSAIGGATGATIGGLIGTDGAVIGGARSIGLEIVRGGATG